MGFRFRKSLKTGPFRMTFSKSGVGYSVGGKGFRVTKKACGGVRTTTSIPETGVSHTEDFGKSKSARPRRKQARSSQVVHEGNQTTQRTNSRKVPIWIPLVLILVPFVLAVLLGIMGSDGASDPTTPPATEPHTESVTASPNEVNEYTIVDKIIELYNSVSTYPVSDLCQMDIQGADYKTEFRLNAFRNAIGKKGMTPYGNVEIINYGSHNRNEFRIYASLDNLDASIELYRNLIIICGGTPSGQLSDTIKQTLSVAGSVNLNSYATLSGILSARYENGSVNGYDIMLEGYVSNLID